MGSQRMGIKQITEKLRCGFNPLCLRFAAFPTQFISTRTPNFSITNRQARQNPSFLNGYVATMSTVWKLVMCNATTTWFQSSLASLNPGL